jgi:hypothetical protein
MSLHQTNNVKERTDKTTGQPAIPEFPPRGPASVSSGDRVWQNRLSSSSLPVNGPLITSPESVNTIFRFIDQKIGAALTHRGIFPSWAGFGPPLATTQLS